MAATDNMNQTQFGAYRPPPSQQRPQHLVQHALYKLKGPPKATPAELADVSHLFGDDTL